MERSDIKLISNQVVVEVGVELGKMLMQSLNPSHAFDTKIAMCFACKI